MLTLTILSISLGCVSAENTDDTNSTMVSIDDDSQIKEMNFDYTDLKTDNDNSEDVLNAAGDYVQINDHKTGKTGSITTSDSSVSLDMTWSGAGGTTLYLYVDGTETTNSYSIGLFDNQGSADSAFTYTFPKEGTYVLKVDTGSHIYESNPITYIYQAGGSQSNGSSAQNASATISIYDMAYPSQSTITSDGVYVSDIAYNIVKSGDGFSDESLEVFVNGVSVGSTTPNTSNRLGNLTFNEDDECILTVVYTAIYNGQTVTATSNALTFITRNTGGNGSGNSTDPEGGKVSISIYDMAYPSQSTIISDGDYVSDIAYNIVKSGDGFSDESLEVFVNGVSVGSTTPNASNRLGNLTFNEDDECILTVVYTAIYNGQTVTATSNALTFITRNTGGNGSGNSSGNGTGGGEPVPQPGEMQLIIRDAANPNNAVINLNEKTNVVLEYYVIIPNGDLLTSDLIIYCNNEALLTINPVDKTFTNIGGSFFLNETGDYVFTARYNYYIFRGDSGSFDSNSITYHVTIGNQTEEIIPTLSISIDNVYYPNPVTANVKSNVDGLYVVMVGENTYNVTVSQGSGSTSFTLPADTYTASVVSISNSSFKNSTTFRIFPKGKLTPVVKTNVSFNDGKATITFNFSYNIDNEMLTVTLNRVTTKNTTIHNGVAVVEFDGLGEGDYSYQFFYAGNDDYGVVNNERTFTIGGSSITNGTGSESGTDTNGTGNQSGTNTNGTGNQSGTNANGTGGNSNQNGTVISSIVAENLKRGQNSAYDFKATFYDKNGNLLNNSQVNFIVNGNDNIVTTDEYGVAKLAKQLSAGTYEIKIRNYATGEVLTRNLNIVNRITNNKDVTVDYSYSSTYKIRLYSDNGNPVGAGENAVITLNNVKYNVKSDKNGYATFKISGLLPKTYTITAEYRGVKVSNNVVVKNLKLNANNAKFKVAKKVKKYKVTLKTSSGKAIAGKKITLKVKGKAYTAKTNSKGVATFKIKNLKKTGSFKATIGYLKISVKKTIKIKR